MTENYRKALDEARRELTETMRQQEEIEQRIVDLRQTVTTLSRLCGEEPDIEGQLGITDAVRMAVKSAPHPLTLTQVKEAVEEIGFPLWKQAAPLASVATILSRLVKGGEVDRKEGDGLKPTFAWISSPFPVGHPLHKVTRKARR